MYFNINGRFLGTECEVAGVYSMPLHFCVHTYTIIMLFKLIFVSNGRRNFKRERSCRREKS